MQEDQSQMQEDQLQVHEDQPQMQEDQPPINEDQPPMAAQANDPIIAPHSPQLQPSSSMNFDTEIPSFSPQHPVHASSSFSGPSVPPELFTFLNDKFDTLNNSIQTMSSNFELRIQRLENTLSAKFIKKKTASDYAAQRFNRLIGTMADASVELKEHQQKLEIVLQGILANSQADVFNTKQTLYEINNIRLSFAHMEQTFSAKVVSTQPSLVSTQWFKTKAEMSTPNEIRSTLESLPRKAILLSGS
ncbi:hypothetical protein Taro_002372 [Colocasia esculenta]|uniref:Uncharacterized protein n=1 Tax=Colocasia esculenta TaxID=4460 RepID=A0A843TIH9_COLES|nr:hypothetical protein [Colocasia esculenta]